MPPRVNTPSTSPDPDGGFDLASSFGVLITRLEALDVAIENQTNMMRTQLDQQLRLAMAGHGRQARAEHVAGVMSQYSPRMREGVLRSLTVSGGAPPDMTAGMTRMTGIGALTSIRNLQTYGAQRLGEMIAGTPLYEQQQTRGTTQPGSRGGMTSGGTVPGAGAPVPPAPNTGAPQTPMIPVGRGPAGVMTPAGPGGGGPGGPGGGGGGPGAPGGGGVPAAGGDGAHRAPGGSAALAQNIGARVAMSGGNLSGILGALKRVPGVGLGVDAAQGIADIYQNQREAGRVYQEVEGGSNLSAQAERVHSLTYQLSMFGRMPEGAAAEAFGEVTSLGYNRQAVNQAGQVQNRQSALDFIYHNYNSTGTDVDQSVKILSTASQNATISLQSVSSAIKALSDTAGKAGTNAENARDNFNDLLNTAIQVGSGTASPQLAGGIAAMQASYGNAFSGTNFSGQLGAGEQYMLAGQLGVSPNAVQYMMRNNPQQYQNALTGSSQQFIRQVLGDQLYTALQQMTTAAGGANVIKSQPVIAQQIASQFLNQYGPSNPILNTNVLAQAFSQLSSVKLTPGNVMQWIVEQVAGNSNASYGSVGGGGGGGAPVSGAVTTGGSGIGSSTGGAPMGQYGLAQPASGSPGGLKYGAKGSTWQQVLQKDSPGAAGAYLSAEGKSGQRSPVLESLLQNVKGGTQVAVRTASGTRVMSFADAMKYYPNEMAAGDVQFFNAQGQALGGTAGFTQGLTDPGANIKGEVSSKGAGSKAGTSWSQFQKQHPGATGGGVQIDLSNEAKQLLKLLPTNNDQAAASATVPTPPYVASPSR